MGSDYKLKIPRLDIARWGVESLRGTSNFEATGLYEQPYLT